MKRLLFCDEIVNEIDNLEHIVIYGAGTMGRALKLCLESDVYNKKVECFLVHSMENNPSDVDGCPVYESSKYLEKNRKIIVALNEKNMLSAKQMLAEEGFSDLIFFDAAGDSWSYLKGNYFLHCAEELYLPFETVGTDEQSATGNSGIKIFVAKSVYDKDIGACKNLSAQEVDIQVGATLTDKSICEIKDDSGDNISLKNRMYCELTALYWAWKNDSSEYVGLSHYRRRFDLSKAELGWVTKNNVDVVLTIPVINTRGVGKQYCLDHGKDDWNILEEEIHKMHPQYDEAFDVFQKQIYFYPCNMFIMRRDVLEEYCEWLFPLLFACESRIGTKQDSYQNRYAGFLAERLLNVYLYFNRDRLRICVAKRKYLTDEIVSR